MQDMPYFMEYSSWYYFDGKRFVLTDKAPEKAKISLEEFYKTEDQMLSGEMRKSNGNMDERKGETG